MRRTIPALIAALLCGGCYHVTVITGASPSAQTIDKPWQNSFVIGLVPPAEVSTKEGCPQGVAQVETERSFLNGLVGAITQSIYTPMHVKVTCSSGR
jgi:hypothetical protein